MIVESPDLTHRLFFQAIQAHDRYGVTGKGVTVAIIDTGFHFRMLELEERVAPYKIDKRSLEELILNPEDDSEDTHADAIAAIIHTVAPEAKLMNIRVASNERGTTEARVLTAIAATIRHKKKHGIPDILNISLGVKRATPASPFFVCNGECQLCNALNIASEAGLLSVVSAGNHGGTPIRGPVTCPGASKEAVTVGAATVEKIERGKNKGKYRVIVSPYSSWGPVQASWRKPNVLAPGTLRVRSRVTFPFPEYVPEVRLHGSHSGTSFANPFVSGAAALIMEKTRDIDLIKNSMYLSAENLGFTELSQGTGLLNIFEAVKFAERRRRRP